MSSGASSSTYDGSRSSSGYGASDCCGPRHHVVYGPRYVRPRPRMMRHPYEAGYDGYNVVDGDADAPGRQFAANMAVEGAWLGDGLVRGQFHARLALARVELDSRTNLLVETENGQPTDAMYLGDAGLFLVPWRSPHWTIRLGGGVRYMVDGRTPGEGHREYALGWNIAGGLDFFPVRPLVVTYRLDLGRLWAANIVQNRATIGAALGPFELYAGYDALMIGKVWLHGPMVGLRGWF